jgi:hypothetical protein
LEHFLILFSRQFELGLLFSDSGLESRQQSLLILMYLFIELIIDAGEIVLATGRSELADVSEKGVGLLGESLELGLEGREVGLGLGRRRGVL